LIPAAFEDAPFQRTHWKLVSGATAGYISDGYTLGVVGIALVAAQTQLSLSPAWLGALGAGSLAGLFLGALLSGSIADRHGRRPIYAYNMAAFVGLSLLQLWVGSAAQLLLIRFLLGLVLGTDYVVCKALLAECVPRLNRGRALSLMGVAWAVGYALAYIAGFALADTSAGAWRWILASSAIPALISLPLRLTAPESPLWLTLAGRSEEAQRIMDDSVGKGYRISNTPALPGAAGNALRSSRWRQLLSSQYRNATFMASTLFFCLVVPYFAVSTFIPQVMAALHVTGNYLAGLIYILGLLAGSVGGFLVVDWFPRRTFVIGSFAITAFALLVSATVSGLPDTVVVLTFTVFSCVLSAAQAQIYVYLPELFPTPVRASGLGIAVAVSRLGAAAGTSLLPLCVTHFGIHVALEICVATLGLGGVASYIWAPETRHIHLDSLARAPGA
jgi:MFS transporter, putative metabolite transport protein